MPNVRDNFYPGLSIYKDLRQSPDSIVNRYSDLLRSKGFESSEDNLHLVLAASKQLYVHLGQEAGDEFRGYEQLTESEGRQIRGTVPLQLELVFDFLSQVLQYVREHPREAIATAAALVALEKFLEEKMGRIGRVIWRRIVAKKAGSSPRRDITRLSKLTRARNSRVRRKKPKPQPDNKLR